MKAWTCLLCLIVLSNAVNLKAQQTVVVNSPNGNIRFTLKLLHQAPVYEVRFKNKLLISSSPLGLNFEQHNFVKDIKISQPVLKDTTEDYSLVTGKTSHVHTHYKQAVIGFQQAKAPFRKLNFTVRVFDDGLAFRYELPQQKGWTDDTITDEHTSFNLAGDPVVTALLLPSYTSSHEGYYSTMPLSQLVADTLMDMPALFQFKDSVFLAITEAALTDYAGMYLCKQDGNLVSKLSPLPHQLTMKVKLTLPHYSPWRVLLVSDRIGALIESNIITTLNEPCKIKDVSWIKPGKTTFPWWNGNVVPDTINAPGNNFVTNQYYIDFCARNNLAYHSVVEYGLHQWYMDDGVGFQPGPHADVTTPVPGLDMKELCDYAATKGVGIRVWVHWAALYPKLDTAFALFEQWGIKGMMVDFMDRDDQLMVNIQTEILQKAAQHHLHIQFHGAYKPTGLNRTYPNEFTREGTLNYEADKWNPAGISPDHDINMPFTRMLAGSTDYHLGGFRAVPQNKFRTQYTRPLVLGTRCHMLGMYVVLENYLSMVCDYPEAYEGQPGFEFIREVPTNWDSTLVLDAQPSKYIVIARRSGDDWFIGAITNHETRTLHLPLTFLGSGTYHATVYADGKNTATDANDIQVNPLTFTASQTLELNLAAGGGAAVHLKR